MKATHRHKKMHGIVFHLCLDGTTIYVSNGGNYWIKSARSNDKRFHDIAEKVNTFKGNK